MLVFLCCCVVLVICLRLFVLVCLLFYVDYVCVVCVLCVFCVVSFAFGLVSFVCVRDCSCLIVFDWFVFVGRVRLVYFVCFVIVCVSVYVSCL